MTAIVVMPRSDGIIAVSDTACFRVSDGRIISFADKVAIYPAWGFLVAQAGMASFGSSLMATVGNEVRDLDHFEDLFPHYAPRLYDMATRFDGGDAQTVGMCIAGWSARRGEWTSLVCTSYPKRSINLETGEESVRKPWQFGSGGGLWMCAIPEADAAAKFGVDLSDVAAEMDRLDPVDLAVRLIFAIREKSGPMEPTEECNARYFEVGGSLNLSLLGDGWARQQTLHRWPDEIGRPVDLTMPSPMPAVSLQGA